MMVFERKSPPPHCSSFPSNSSIPLHEAENLRNLEKLPLLMILIHIVPPPLRDSFIPYSCRDYINRTCFLYCAKESQYSKKFEHFYNSSHLSNRLVPWLSPLTILIWKIRWETRKMITIAISGSKVLTNSW